MQRLGKIQNRDKGSDRHLCTWIKGLLIVSTSYAPWSFQA